MRDARNPVGGVGRPVVTPSDRPAALPTRRMPRFAASASYEFDLEPQATWRGVIVAGSWQRAASQAVRELRRTHPGRRARSVVVVLELDR